MLLLSQLWLLSKRERKGASRAPVNQKSARTTNNVSSSPLRCSDFTIASAPPRIVRADGTWALANHSVRSRIKKMSPAGPSYAPAVDENSGVFASLLWNGGVGL